MRLGGQVFESYDTPDQWVSAMRRLGYRAAYCPVDAGASVEVIRAYAAAAAQADIVIAEVGAWSNPLSADAETRRAALATCQEQLALADAIGARCCVNIAGSRGERWDGPHPANLTSETFELIVDTVRAIIDAVKPTRTFYTLTRLRLRPTRCMRREPKRRRWAWPPVAGTRRVRYTALCIKTAERSVDSEESPTTGGQYERTT